MSTTTEFEWTTGTRFLAGAAAIATITSYVGIVGFARDVVGMGTLEAITLAGFFEVGLVGAGFKAREAAANGEGTRTLSAITWALSLATGIFAAWHEVEVGASDAAAVFRFVVPLAAAGFWHIVLVGARNHAIGRTLREVREDGRFHSMITAQRDRHRLAAYGVKGRKLDRATRRQDRAEARALRMIDPAQMRDMSTKWGHAMNAVVTTRVGSAIASDPSAQLRTAQDRVTPTQEPITRPAAPAANSTDYALAEVRKIESVKRPVAQQSAHLPKPVQKPRKAPGKTAQKVSDADRANVLERVRNGDLSKRAAAAELGVSDGTIRNWIEKDEAAS